ncbi:38K protein [Carcinus maenas nudivirus]|uniref:38K protein n=1 Tax=Carcinus maenas nudivirus TaxID=2880837 RepID=A0AAE8Y191_9VIRU|nr:38K protein [Carcinus maenas nudivirus]UBZ25638.1 38K protein [Carcinus maenas nudivirus]
MKKKILFIKNLPENSKWGKWIIKNTYKLFTHIYILKNLSSQLLKIETLNNNKNDDPPGLYYINKIYNNIKTYSMLLNLGSFEESNTDSTYNVHVDYLYYKITYQFDKKAFINNIKSQLDGFFRQKIEVNSTTSVAILDLDDTIINKNGDVIIKNLHKYLSTIQSMFDIIILWSHGCQSHVNNTFETTLSDYKIYFKDVMARQSSFKLINKGIGRVLKFLNSRYDICELSSTLLIDDQSCNYNKDYDYFIHVPVYDRLFNVKMWKLLSLIQKNLAKNELS